MFRAIGLRHLECLHLHPHHRTPKPQDEVLMNGKYYAKRLFMMWERYIFW